MPSVRLKIAVVGTGGVARQRSAETRILFVGATAARHLVDAPGVGRLRAGGKRAAERDHRAHALRHHLGELARVEAAEAPADQRDLAAVGVVQLLHQIDHRVLHAVAQAEIAALTPAADGIAAALQEAAQRTRRGVGRNEARAIPAPDDRRRAGARLSSGKAPRNAPNSEMARPSRNISVLDGGRSVCAATDIVSPVRAGPLRLGSRPMVQWNRRKRGRIVPQRNIVT